MLQSQAIMFVGTIRKKLSNFLPMQCFNRKPLFSKECSHGVPQNARQCRPKEAMVNMNLLATEQLTMSISSLHYRDTKPTDEMNAPEHLLLMYTYLSHNCIANYVTNIQHVREI